MYGLQLLDVKIPYLFIHVDGVSLNIQQSFKVVPQDRTANLLDCL